MIVSNALSIYGEILIVILPFILRELSEYIMMMISLQVHEIAMVSAIQEAQKDNLRSFNDYMMRVMEVGTA